MTSRAFLIHMMALFMLSICITGNCLAQNDEKPTYIFTDNRISLADTLLSHKDYTRALEAYKVALETYKTESFYEGMVYATERMAFCYRRLKNDGLSAETFQQAIDLAKEKLEPNHMLLSKAYLNNGIRAHYNDNTLIATFLLDSAMWSYSNSQTGSMRTYQKIVEYKFYTQYYSRVNSDSLIKYAYEKMKMFDHEKSGINKEIYMITDFGRAFYRIGDYGKSITYCLEAVKKAKQNRQIVRPFYYSDALFTLGRSFSMLQKHQKALAISNELIEYTQKENPESGDLVAYMNLKAVTLIELERYEEARTLYHEILNSERSTSGSRNFFIHILMNLGVSYSQQNDFVNGLPYLLRALQLQKQLNIPSDIELSTRYRYIGNLYSNKLDYKNASSYYDSALSVLITSYKSHGLNFLSNTNENLSSPTLELLVKKTRMLYHLQKEKNPKSSEIELSILHYIQEISHHLFLNRLESDSEETKLSLANDFKGLYETAIAYCHLQHEEQLDTILIAEILKNMARGKSLLFLEQLDDHNLVFNKNVSSELQLEFSTTKGSVDSLDNQINQQIALDPLGDSVMILNTEKMKWNARLAEVRETIEKEYPDAGNDFFSREVSIESLRADHQLSSEKALVEYFVGDSAIFVVGLSGQKTSFHRIEKDELFNTALSSFLGEVNTAPDSREMALHLQSFGEASHALYNALLKPVLDDLGTIENLIIVPDEILSRVPFELLISRWSGRETSFKELNYLLKDTKVSHLLSSKISFNEFTQSQGKGMLGFGYTGQGVTDERAAMGGLPGALKEINFLKSNFEGDYYIGNEGTKRQFLKKAGDYDVIHLALHGVSDSVNRYNSALVFNGDQDYYMTSTDLYRTRLKSKLAVLSACETGIGKISEGEGSFSIARGFAIAGVPAIVTTLWKVNDQAGASIMEQFYLNLQAGNKKDDALRQAKLTYLQKADNLSSSPFYWGNYILIGDSREIELREKENLPWHWVLITVIVLGSLGLGLRRLSRKSFYQAS